jgi:hypothetical protein
VVNEQRNSQRQRQFLRGFVRVTHNNTTIDCIVRDISDTGAKLRLKYTTPMPEFFELHIPSKGKFANSKLIWKNGCEVGICFDSPCAFGSTSSTGEDEMSDRFARLEDEITALKQTLKQLQKRLDQTEAA